MQRRTFLKLGVGALAGSALGACGGAHDGGALIEPDPQAAPAPATAKPGAQPASSNTGMMEATPP